MAPSGNFEKFVRMLSPKVVLQTLLHEWVNQSVDLPGQQKQRSNNVPISSLVADRPGMCYTSAIAPKLTGQTTQATVTYAQALAQRLQQYCHPASGWTLLPHQQVAANLHIAVTQQGWLTFTLSEVGISAWLAFVAKQVTNIDHEQSPPELVDATALSPSKFPLCDRLHLSLPAFVAWAYDRCKTQLNWLDQQQDAPSPNQSETSIRDRPLTETPPSVSASQQLLKATICTVDGLAIHPLRSPILWQQSYTLAAAVYTFDAAMSFTILRTLSPARHNPTYSTLRAVHGLLALLLVQMGLPRHV